MMNIETENLTKVLTVFNESFVMNGL